MAFDLKRIASEHQAAPLASPFPLDVAIACLCDVFRRAGAAPVPSDGFDAYRVNHALFSEQLGMLAHFLSATSLRGESIRALKPEVDAKAVAIAFFTAIEPLTAEMIRSNAFRQEEFLRRWIEAIGGEIAGEPKKRSLERLAQLDYRQALSEYAKAEKDRQREAEQRKKALAEAEQRATDARGWRE